MMALTTGSQVTQRPTGDQPGLHGSAILPWISQPLCSHQIILVTPKKEGSKRLNGTLYDSIDAFKKTAGFLGNQSHFR